MIPIERTKIEFEDPISGDNVFIMVRMLGDLTGILVTSRHGGDADVWLGPAECLSLREALEGAVRIAHSAERMTGDTLATIHSNYDGATNRSEVTVGIRDGLISLILSFTEGEDEDRVHIFLKPSECVRLSEALGATTSTGDPATGTE